MYGKHRSDHELVTTCHEVDVLKHSAEDVQGLEESLVARGVVERVECIEGAEEQEPETITQERLDGMSVLVGDKYLVSCRSCRLFRGRCVKKRSDFCPSKCEKRVSFSGRARRRNPGRGGVPQGSGGGQENRSQIFDEQRGRRHYYGVCECDDAQPFAGGVVRSVRRFCLGA